MINQPCSASEGASNRISSLCWSLSVMLDQINHHVINEEAFYI